MDRVNNSQLELFTDGQTSTNQNNPVRNSFLGYMRAYEKVIILGICFIITAVIAFSLGVEKGKDTADLIKNMRFTAAKTNLPVLKNPPQTNIKLQQTQKPIINSNALKNNYTIQIASYQNKTNALSEAQVLNNKGLKAFIVNTKTHSILCVGNFANEETAKTLLIQLKGKYKGIFIRRL